MSGRDWLIVAPRLFAIWAMYVAIIRTVSLAEIRIQESLFAQDYFGPNSYLYEFTFFGSFPQNAVIIVLSLIVVFSTPLLIRLAYGPQQELPPTLDARSRRMSGRDWLIVAPRFLGITAIFAAAVRAFILIDLRVLEWIGELELSLMGPDVVFIFFGSLPQNAAIGILGCLVIFITPWTVHRVYGPDD